MAFPSSPTDGQIYHGFIYDEANGVWNKLGPATAGNTSPGIMKYNGTTQEEGSFHYGNDPLGTAVATLAYNGYLYSTRSYNAVYNDIAEYFLAHDKQFENKVYVLDKEGYAVLSNKKSDNNVLGVCTDSPAYVMKSEYKDKGVIIALAGTVKVEVDKEVKPRDYLVSSKNGKATKASNLDIAFNRDALIGRVLFYNDEDKTAIIKVGR